MLTLSSVHWVMNIWEEPILVHVLDKPEVMNTGTDDWDEMPSA